MPPANELGSRQVAPRKSSAHLVRGPAACRDCPAGRKQCQPSSCSNDRLVKKHSGVEALLRLEQYLTPQALTTWPGCWAVQMNRPLPSLILSEGGAFALNRRIAAPATPRVMKQILLRISTVFSEVR